MRTKIILVSSLFVLAILLFGVNLSMSANTPAPSPSYGFDVSIVPDQQASDTYLAKLLVRELASDKIIAAPMVRFRAGEPANTTVGDGGDGMSIQFSVAVNAAAAEYDASVLHAKTIVSRSQGKISLRN